MEKADIAVKVKNILVNVLGHGNFEMRDNLTAPEVEGWDSMTHMTIITEIEEGFNIKFKLKDLNKLHNMGTLIELIQSKL